MFSETQVYFEQKGSELVAVEIGQNSRLPVVASLHRVLFALGLDIRSYRARPDGTGIVERLVLERQDGGRIDGLWCARAKAAILPIALQASAAVPR